MKKCGYRIVAIIVYLLVIMATNSVKTTITNEAQTGKTREPTFIVDLAISVNVSLSDHLVHLLIRQLLPEVRHHVTQLGGRDETVSVLVEDAEGLTDLLLGVRLLHLPRHHGQELGEVDGAVSVGVNLVDHVLQLGLRGVLPERAHDGAQLLGGDGPISVLVEKGECLLEFGDMFLVQLVGLRTRGRNNSGLNTTEVKLSHVMHHFQFDL